MSSVYNPHEISHLYSSIEEIQTFVKTAHENISELEETLVDFKDSEPIGVLFGQRTFFYY